ncbi:LysR substrate-binding domain-containing protein [Aeromicrobium sp. CF4.19]|uniref:LysR substrate-binding domain-containing protein n=1 Tax=Aeromicrobium sp. CF4.19 TaxID=3373082 RepID=UPI003EE64D54
MFSLDQLRGFVAVAEELHFGRAAERLQMTQPPLSRQIQKLERSVGVRLLDRDNRRVSLTPGGTVFLDEARRLLALADVAPDRARRIQAGSAGTVRIGFTAASTYGTLTRLLNEIGAALPDIDLDLYEMVTGQQVAGLASGELDLGLARPPFDTEQFASRLLHREEMVLAVPVDHWMTMLDRDVVATDLVQEPIIMHSPTKARYFYDLVVRMVPIAHQNVVHTVSQILTMTWLVAGGRGIAFVPESAMGLHVDGVTHLSLRAISDQPAELHLLWGRGTDNPALQSVLDVLK